MMHSNGSIVFLSGHRRSKANWPVIAILTSAILLGGCQGRIDVNGNMPDSGRVLQIQPGTQSKQQVAEILGTPSTVSTFQDNTWYYIGRKTETFAFFRPEVIDQQVLVVKFDDTDTVSDMNVYGVEDGQIIDPVSRTTPTSGQELTILQQIFGNLGKFNKGAE